MNGRGGMLPVRAVWWLWHRAGMLVLLVVLLDIAMKPAFERLMGGLFAADVAGHVADVVTLLVAIGGLSWLTMSRVIRGQVLSLRAQTFIEAARAAYGWTHAPFEIPKEVRDAWTETGKRGYADIETYRREFLERFVTWPPSPLEPLSPMM